MMAAAGAQLLPLPSPVLELISPRTAEWMQFLWATAPGTAQLDPSRQHSLAFSPQDVAQSMAASTAYLLWLLVALRVFRGGLAHRALWTVAGVGLASFGIALAQALLGAERILGVYAIRGAAPTAFMSTFVNPNFQACLYSVSGLVSLGLASDSRHRGPARGFAAVAAAASFAGVCLTLSRGGMLMLLPALATWFFLSPRSAEVRRPALITLALTTFAAVVSAVYLDGTGLGRELSSTVATASGERVGKWLVWGPASEIVRDFWPAGIGKGGFRFAFDQAAPILTQRLTYDSPESWPLQLTLDYGVPAAVVITGASALAVLRPIAARPVSARRAGAFAALVYVLLHDLLDFSLSAPGIVFPCLAALASAWSHDDQDGRVRRAPDGMVVRPVAIAALSLLTAAGGVFTWSIAPDTLESDRLKLRMLAAKASPAEEFDTAFVAARRRRPVDYQIYWLRGERLVRAGESPAAASAAVFYLNRALFLRPTHAASHFLAAEILRRAGRTWQSNLEYRLAILHAGDPQQERSFLRRCIGVGLSIDDLIYIAGDDLGVQTRLLLPLMERRGAAVALEAVTRMSLVARSRHDPLARRHVANILLAAGSLGTLRTAIDELAETDPRSPETWYWQALVARTEGDLPAAVLHIRRARGLASEPEVFARMLKVECELYREQKEVAPLSGLLRELVSRPEVLPDIYAHRATLSQSLGDASAAAADWRRAIQLRPGWVGPRLGLAEVLSELGRRREALRLYEEVLRMDPGHPAASKAKRRLEVQLTDQRVE